MDGFKSQNYESLGNQMDGFKSQNSELFFGELRSRRILFEMEAINVEWVLSYGERDSLPTSNGSSLMWKAQLASRRRNDCRIDSMCL